MNRAYAMSFRLRVDAIREYTGRCPIRLYDTQNREFFTRRMLNEYIHEEHEKRKDLAGRDRWGDPVQDEVEEIGRYAILSHRWNDEEISLDEIPAALEHGKHVKKKAQRKLRGFFQEARAHGCRFVWFDTGCINQKNGPELEESIRSMFSWYRNAHVCIVYLGGTQVFELNWWVNEWFRRGWTLQELLAPQRLQFYSKSWRRIGAIDRTAFTHDEQFLGKLVSATGISRKHLIDLITPGPQHAVTMFKYISSRETTRPEDLSYALISLLDISMPIAYGEGAELAFYHLQVACARESPSRALFHWFGDPCRRNSMLARHPCAFTFEDLEERLGLHWNTTVPVPPLSLALGIEFDDVLAPNEVEDTNNIDNSFSFTNTGVGIMLWILRPAGPPRLLSPTLMIAYYSYTILKRYDVGFLRSSFRDQSPISDQSLVIGVYGHDGETTYAALLKMGSPGGHTVYTRIADDIVFVRLPPMSAIMESKFSKPQRVFIK